METVPTVYLVRNPNQPVTVTLTDDPAVGSQPVAVVAAGSVTVQYVTNGRSLNNDAPVVSIISGCHVYLEPLPGGPNGKINNIAVIAAGGLWSAELQPVISCVSNVANVEIQGVVVLGQPPYLFNECLDTATSALVKASGVNRRSSLPNNWADRDTAYWPGRIGSGWVLQ